MPLDEFITIVDCPVDDLLRDLAPGRLRSRGPTPTPADAEVIAIELVGEFLGIDRDRAIYRHSCHHHADLFPAPPRVHRTTFARQAANPWAVKRLMQRHLAGRLAADACRFARSKYCKRFAGQAAFGDDHVRRGLIYGLRLHARCTSDGAIVAFDLAPANVSEPAMVAQLDPPPGSVGIGDRNYWHPDSQWALAGRGVTLHATFRTKSKDPDPQRSTRPGRVRWMIEAVFGMPAERYHLKRTWARDLWHLCHRLIRKVLGHTLAVWINVTNGHQPLRFDALVA